MNFNIRNIFSKKDFSQPTETSGNVFSTVSQRLSGESPRMTQSNMNLYLGKYADQAWIYSCIKIIQTKAAGVPIKVYRKIGDEDLEEIKDHPLFRLLESANPYMTGYDLLESTHGYIELVGNAYWLKDKMSEGKPMELYPLNPACIKIKTDARGFVVGYDYELTPGKVYATYRPDEILHFKTWNPMNPIYGLAPICAGRDSSDTMMFSDQYNKAFFRNGAEPAGLLTSDSQIDEDSKKKIASSWAKLHRGVRKAFNVAILDSGLKYQQTATSHKDMAFSELKRMSREDVLTVFNMPPIMVGVFDEANYSNAREQRRIFWVDCIVPRLRKVESVINEYLTKTYDANVIVKHDLSGIEDLSEDVDTRSRADSYEVQAGIVTVNEVRKRKNLSPVPWGNTWFAPMGLSPVGESNNPQDVVVEDEPTPANEPTPKPDLSQPKPTPSAKPKKSQSDIQTIEQPIDPKKVQRDIVWMKYKGLTDRLEKKWSPVMRRLFNDQEKEVIHNLHKSGWERILNQNVLDKFKNVKQSVNVVLFDRTHSRTVFRRDASVLMAETIAASANKEISDYDLGIDFNLKDHNVSAWINNKAFKFSEEVNSTTEESLRSELEDAIANGETLSQVEDRIAGVFDIARGSRTAMIARTEVISASNAGAMESYKQSGVVGGTEWITSRDNLVRDEHQIDGEVADVDSVFSNGLKYPGDPTGEPGNVINCRCTVAPIVNKDLVDSLGD